MVTAVMILTWLAAEPALIRPYPSVQECEKALDDALRSPGASGVCLSLPIRGKKDLMKIAGD